MNEKTAFLATELELPPVSEGTPPVPLIRMSVPAGGPIVPSRVQAVGASAVGNNNAGDAHAPAVPRSSADYDAAEHDAAEHDVFERAADIEHSAGIVYSADTPHGAENESVTRAVAPGRGEGRARADFSQRAALVVGDIVADKYSVGPVIGAGGMGIVYKARHIELGTWVAIKVIRPDIAQNSSLWRRFAREARALAALHNKHVVRVHDAGTLPSGLRYLVMELLDGTDLRRLLLTRGALKAPDAVDHVLQVCSALGDAHRLHIIHRDIKPENIFLARFRACDPTIKLLDFGVARFLDDTGQLTVPGRGVGSPRYLSPEQVQNPGSADQRSDIWGAGLLLYELITGRSPFDGMNTAQTCLSICQGPIPPIHEVCPGLSRELSAVIMRCLEIDPTRRFQSADELSAALEPFSSRHLRPNTGDTTEPPPVAGPKPVDKGKRYSWFVPRWLCTGLALPGL